MIKIKYTPGSFEYIPLFYLGNTIYLLYCFPHWHTPFFNEYLFVITHSLAVAVSACQLHNREQIHCNCLLYRAKRLACWRMMSLLKVVDLVFWWLAMAFRLQLHSNLCMFLTIVTQYFFYNFLPLHAIHYYLLPPFLTLQFFISFVWLPWQMFFFSPHSLHEVFCSQ